jgi:hypothetical protein
MALYPPSLLIPASEIDPGLLKDIRRQALSQVQALAAAGDTVSNLVVRDLLPSDINQSTGGSTPLGRLTTGALTAQTLTSIYSFTLQQNQALAFFGFNSLQPNSQFDEIDFTLPGGGTLSKVVLQNLYSEQNAKGYFQPIYYKPLEVINIFALSNAGISSPGEPFQVLGFIAEPQGKYVQTRNVTVPGLPGFIAQ